MAFAGARKRVKNDINVTPLVDVVLVLLIIFMVVTPLLHRGKEVNLPKARTTDDSKMPDALIISVMRDRTVWIDTNRADGAQLRATLADEIRRKPDRKILVKGDDSLLVRDMRALLSDARAAGARGLSLAVEEAKK